MKQYTDNPNTNKYYQEQFTYLTINNYPALRIYITDIPDPGAGVEYYIFAPVSSETINEFRTSILGSGVGTVDSYVYQFGFISGGEGSTHPLPATSDVFQNQLHNFDELVSTFKVDEQRSVP